METSIIRDFNDYNNSFINSRNKYVIFLHIISELFDLLEQISNSILNSLSLSRVSKIFNLLRKALRVNKRIILRPTARSLRPTGSFLWGGGGGGEPPPHLRPCLVVRHFFAFVTEDPFGSSPLYSFKLGFEHVLRRGPNLGSIT